MSHLILSLQLRRSCPFVFHLHRPFHRPSAFFKDLLAVSFPTSFPLFLLSVVTGISHEVFEAVYPDQVNKIATSQSSMHTGMPSPTHGGVLPSPCPLKAIFFVSLQIPEQRVNAYHTLFWGSLFSLTKSNARFCVAFRESSLNGQGRN